MAGKVVDDAGTGRDASLRCTEYTGSAKEGSCELASLPYYLNNST